LGEVAREGSREMGGYILSPSCSPATSTSVCSSVVFEFVLFDSKFVLPFKLSYVLFPDFPKCLLANALFGIFRYTMLTV
jgi:hypothetical protein